MSCACKNCSCKNKQPAVVKFTPTNQYPHYQNGLTEGKLYAVETDEDLVLPEIYEHDQTVTVWDDKGHLHEIYKADYEVVIDVDPRSVLPNKRYIELM